jgi:hypothetical protein
LWGAAMAANRDGRNRSRRGLGSAQDRPNR